MAVSLKFSDGSVYDDSATMKSRIAKLECGLRLVRDQIKEDHDMNLPTDRAAQSLILADIDIAMSD
jgi:hypothetical protein